MSRHPSGKRHPDLNEAAITAHRETQALEPLIHEKMRLGIVSALATSGPLAFTTLRELLETTDGNISVHARKLEQAGYIVCTKEFEDRKPKTVYTLTDEGRRALDAYLQHLELLLNAMRGR